MATAVGARVTAENRPVFINLPVPGTKQSVCSWPNVVPSVPAEIELDRLERSWHVGVHTGDGGRSNTVRNERYRAHQDHGGCCSCRSQRLDCLVNRFVQIQAPTWLHYLREIVFFFKLIRRPMRPVDLTSRTESLSKQVFVQVAVSILLCG